MPLGGLMYKTIASSVAAFAMLVGLIGTAAAAPLEKIAMNIFSLPSLGAFLPPIIKARKFDEKNGLDIAFTEEPPEAYAADFNSGRFQVGGSATPSNLGVAILRGVKITYLFNVFDFWGAVVTGRPDVHTLKDLEGKDLAAAKSTMNYVMFAWIARQQGVDLSKIAVISTATAGLVGYALADRAAAVQIWEPGYTTLVTQKPELRTIDMKIADTWEKYTGSRHLPYLGVGAHIDWVEQHKTAVPKLYATYKDAAEWIVAHPDEAAKLISAKGSADEQKAVAAIIRSNERLGLDMQWASDQRKEIEALYEVAKSVGFLPGIPGPSSIYERPKD
jgi:NitT/TauT family transport system substrate-binding protein